jgi:hypothetical protein
MISSVYKWVSAKLNNITEAQQQIEWQESLDTAVELIGNIKDIQGEDGQTELREILVDLKEKESGHLVNDNETGRQATGVIYSLPWGDHMSTETA